VDSPVANVLTTPAGVTLLTELAKKLAVNRFPSASNAIPHGPFKPVAYVLTTPAG
jgi:hypothetical protein